MELAKLKQVSLADLANFLSEDHRNFSVLTANLKIIDSTQRTSVTLSKNSAKSFYLGQRSLIQKPKEDKPNPTDDCLTDAQNCEYFQFFSSKEKKLYTRFNDKCEANFEGSEAQQPLLFLTLTFNTSQDNLYTWTTSWNHEDEVWNRLQSKAKYDLKLWAKHFDSSAHPLKILIQKISLEDTSNLEKANLYVAKFLRAVRNKWKPQNWKWTIVAELQKRGIWHFHLLSTPIVPYIHKCKLSNNFTSCWNCRTYLSELWPWGRVESRSPGKKTISKYLAKYISKSFHLRSLYVQHGLKENHKVYRFFKNLYQYEEVAVNMLNNKRYNSANQLISNHQKVFKKADETYYYCTNERLVATCQKPFTSKKNFRLGTTNISVRPLLKLAKKSKEDLILKPPKKPKLSTDFQEFLIICLLSLCKKAKFSHLPLEKNKVPKQEGFCDKYADNHFQIRPVLHFEFSPENSEAVKHFFTNLDTYAEEYDMEESKDFYYYPSNQPNISPEMARNYFLNSWYSDYCQDYFKLPLWEQRKGGTIM